MGGAYPVKISSLLSVSNRCQTCPDVHSSVFMCFYKELASCLPNFEQRCKRLSRYTLVGLYAF